MPVGGSTIPCPAVVAGVVVLGSVLENTNVIALVLPVLVNVVVPPRCWLAFITRCHAVVTEKLVPLNPAVTTLANSELVEPMLAEF